VLCEKELFSHPYDTIYNSSLRFAVEIIAWVAGPWLASMFSTWLIAPSLIVLVGLPAIFSTRNDKRNVIIATKGIVRVAIELSLYFVAAIAPWYIWSTQFSAGTTCVVIIALLVGAPRLKWLCNGAPKA